MNVHMFSKTYPLRNINLSFKQILYYVQKLIFWYVRWVTGLIGNITNWFRLGLGLSLAKSMSSILGILNSYVTLAILCHLTLFIFKCRSYCSYCLILCHLSNTISIQNKFHVTSAILYHLTCIRSMSSYITQQRQRYIHGKRNSMQPQQLYITLQAQHLCHVTLNRRCTYVVK